jgi:hypothetical protein
MKWFGYFIGAIVILATSFAGGALSHWMMRRATGGDVIECSKLIVNDKQGRPRATIEVGNPFGGEECAMMILQGETDKARVILAANDKGGIMGVSFGKDQTAIACKVSETYASFGVKGQRARFRLYGDNKAFLDMKSGDTNTMFDSDGLSISKGLFDSRLRLSVKDDQPSVRLYSGKSKLRAVLGSTDLQTTSTGATEKTAVSSLTLFDKDGKVIRSVP